MELVEPSTRYKESFAAAVREFSADSVHNVRAERYHKILQENLLDDFDKYVSDLKSHARGENLPEGYVPASHFWLVDDDVYVGSIDIRHRLTPYLLEAGGHIGYDIRPTQRRKGYGKLMLGLALEKAKILGLDRVLLTCDETNEGSRKIIEANGGVLEDRRPNPDGGPGKLRYWITV